MTGTCVPVMVVNHVTVDIAAPPDAVWAVILEDYVAAGKFLALGASVEHVNDPAHPLGAYRMHLVEDGVVDDRLMVITERDVAARRLSVWARYDDDADGVTDVCATYQAQQTPAGTRYALDCHSRVQVEAPEDDLPRHVAARVARLTADFNDYLSGYLHDIRRRVEGRD